MAELMAGLGAEAELLAESAMEKRMAALWQRAIGKMLAGRGAVAEILLPGRAIGKKMLAGGAAAELLAGNRRKALRHKKKRVTPKPSRTCGSPSCLLTTCYGCLRFAIS